MIKKYSIKITNTLINNAIIDKELYEEYIYGFEMLIEKIIGYSILLMIALYLNLFIPSTIFMGFFLTLRKSSGGYHANTYLGCFIGTLLLYLFCAKVFSILLMSIGNYMYIFLFIMCIFIFYLSPVNHPNLSLDSKEIMMCRKRTRFVLVLELSLILIGTYFNINSIYVVFASMGIIICAVLIIIAKLIKQEVNEDEERYIKTSCSEIN